MAGPHSLSYPLSFLSRYLKRLVRSLVYLPSDLQYYSIKVYFHHPTGSRNVFGSVIEEKVVFIIDTSGSMLPHMTKLKEQLHTLIHEQLAPNKCSFNFIRYSSDVVLWQNDLMEPTDDNCNDAKIWLNELKAHGESLWGPPHTKPRQFPSFPVIFNQLSVILVPVTPCQCPVNFPWFLVIPLNLLMFHQLKLYSHCPVIFKSIPVIQEMTGVDWKRR